MKSLKFGWTYASLEDYRNGVPKRFWLLDDAGFPKRPATQQEQRLVEWFRSRNGDLIDEREWEEELQERIDSDLPLSELIINEPFDLKDETPPAAGSIPVATRFNDERITPQPGTS